MKVLINAYACSPGMGSEPGMGWNWVVNLAKHCELFIITESEFKDKIEKALPGLPQRDNMHFYYNPVPQKVRDMCWNQGDWRFYWYYRKWQKRTLKMARAICANNQIDILHQLNMIGFREPGLLWKIKGYKFVWGPVGGMETMPITYLKGAGFKMILFNRLKNLINSLQYRFQPNVRRAVHRAGSLVAATAGCKRNLDAFYHKDTILLNETGCQANSDSSISRREGDARLNVLWVGKFDFRKQLPLAIKAIAQVRDLDVYLRIAGSGEINPFLSLARELGVSDKIEFLGQVDHEKMNDLMLGSDVFMFTSIMDATSTVVMEALQNRLPIICFDTCGFGTVVDETVGIKINLSTPEQSVKDFGRALRTLYEDREYLQRLSDGCKERVKLFEWDRKALDMIEIYKCTHTLT